MQKSTDAEACVWTYIYVCLEMHDKLHQFVCVVKIDQSIDLSIYFDAMLLR